MAGLYYAAIKINYQASLYLKIFIYICGYEISEWRACQTVRNRSEFYKKRN